jgi:predicted ATPase/transcriptional regulator with XRE-family HTH domain
MVTADGEMSFGWRVRQRREALGLTRKELAQRISCSIEMIRKIESGERYPSVEIAKLLAEQLAIDPDEQFFRRQPGSRRAMRSQLIAPEYPLIGRQAEWEALRAAWRNALQGEAHLICIAGDAGIGKTRLAEELLIHAHRQGYSVARTRAYALEGRLAYAPIAGWLRSPRLAARVRTLDAVWRSEIARLLPELLIEDATLPPPQPLTERWQLKRLFEALLQVFSAEEQFHPLLLLLDDLQWCDAETLEWLQYLLSAAPHLKLLVVGTVRDAEVDADHPLHTWQRKLLEDGQLTSLPLAPLSQAETASLGAAVAQQQLDAQVIARLHDECVGNPLFVIESIRYSQHGELRVVSRPTPLHPASVSLPPKIYAVIRSRLAQLSPDARALSELAAVFGHAFTLELLMQSVQHDEDMVIHGLDELWQRRVIREVDEGHYDFSHDTIRDVAYAEIGLVLRHLLHHRVAEALEAINGGELDAISGELAIHYARANLSAKAIHYHQRAAGVARRTFANEDAVDHLSQAVHLLQSLPETTERQQQELSLQIELSAALQAARSMTAAEVEAAYRRAEELARAVGEPPELFPARFGWWVFQFSMAEQRAALEIGKELLASAQKWGKPDFILQAHHALWTSSFATGDFPAALAHCEQGQAIYRPETHHAQLYVYGSHDPGVCGLSFAAPARWLLGFPDQALETSREALELSKSFTHPASEAQSWYWSAVLHQLRYDVDEVRLHAEAANRIRGKHVVPFWSGWDTCLLGWADVLQGQHAAGIEHIQRGLDDMLSRRGRLLHSYFMTLLAEAYERSGQLDRGLQTLDAALAEAEHTGELWWTAEMHRLKGDLLLQQGDEGIAEQSYFRAIEIAQQQYAKSLELRATMALCRLWQRQGKKAQAFRVLSELYGWFTEGFETHDLRAAQELLQTLS